MGRYSSQEPYILGAAGMLAFFAAWQALNSFGIVEEFFISSPWHVWQKTIEMLGEGMIISDVLVSGREFLVGFGLAMAFGIPLGFLMGWYRYVEWSLDPYVWFLYSAPLIAFYPLFIYWLGMGTPTVITISFLLSVFPILVNTMTGVQNVDGSLIKAARSFGANDYEIFRKISLPASLPIVVAGLRLGVGRAMVGVIVGEFFGANAGLGYRIAYFGGRMQTTEMFVFLVLVGILGVLLTQILRACEGRFANWRTSS